MKRTALRHVSSRRSSKLRIYSKLKKEFLDNHPFCQACIEDDMCSMPHRSVDVHHKEGRLGNKLLAVDTWLAVCRTCHDFIHSHGRWAREKGYLK